MFRSDSLWNQGYYCKELMLRDYDFLARDCDNHFNHPSCSPAGRRIPFEVPRSKCHNLSGEWAYQWCTPDRRLLLLVELFTLWFFEATLYRPTTETEPFKRQSKLCFWERPFSGFWTFSRQKQLAVSADPTHVQLLKQLVERFQGPTDLILLENLFTNRPCEQLTKKIQKTSNN